MKVIGHRYQDELKLAQLLADAAKCEFSDPNRCAEILRGEGGNIGKVEHWPIRIHSNLPVHRDSSSTMAPRKTVGILGEYNLRSPSIWSLKL